MKNFVIEELYPEFNNLYGDRGNGEYLCEKLKRAGRSCELVKTNLFDEPAFVSRDVDILLIGPAGEIQQKKEAERLLLFKEQIEKRIENGGVTLATGNAFELFGEYIESEKGEKTSCLGLFPYYAKQFSKLRYNDSSIGQFGEMKITGFKNLLSHSYGQLPYPFLKMIRGCGMNKESEIEGIHKNNFFATYHTGPLLPLNPNFADYLIKLADPAYESVWFEFEKTAYENRINELLK